MLDALAEGDAVGLVLLRPSSPEVVLLRSWLATDVEIALPADEEVDAVHAVLGGNRGEAERAVARRLAGTRLVVAHPATKTELFFSPMLPPESLLPLGDVPASTVRDLVGSATRPEALLHGASADLDRVDSAIAELLDRGRDASHVLADLPPELRNVVSEALDRSSFRRPARPVVPKLGHWTVGLDPHL